MSLSIIPLTQPMYNIYRAYNEVFLRYGNEVYIDGLIDKTPKPGAPFNVVRSLAETYVDNLLAIYNTRVSIQIRTNSENRLGQFYMWVAIILLFGLQMGIQFAINSKRKFLENLNDTKKLHEFMKYAILYRIAVLIAFVFLLTLVVMSYTRKRDINNKIGQVNFGEGTLMTEHMSIVFDRFISAPIPKSGARFCKYRVLKAEKKQYIDLISYTKLFKYAKEGKVWKAIAGLSPAENARQAIFAYVLSQRGLSIVLDGITNRNIRFPGFYIAGDPYQGFKQMGGASSAAPRDGNPSRLLREIQAIDIIGQVNRVSDAVAYFKDLLAKKGGQVGGANAESRIVDTLKKMFGERRLMSRNLIPVRLHEDIIRSDLNNAQECIAACQSSPACVYSIYDVTTGTCALVNKDQVAKYPLFYVQDEPDQFQQYEVYVKDKNDIYLSHSKKASEIQGLASAMRFIDDRAHPGLEKENGCIYTADGGVCMGQNYQSEDSVNFNIFKDSTIASLTKQQSHFTVRTTTNALIDYEMSKNFSIIERNRDKFGDIVVDVITKADPSGSFVLDGGAISEIADAAASAYPEHAAEMKSMMIDILNEVPVRIARLAVATEAETPDKRDLHYATGTELVGKLSSMTPHEFSGKFLTHAYNLYSCGEGLQKMHRFYDYTTMDIQRGTTILALLATLVMLEGICYGIYFWFNNFPVFAKEYTRLTNIIQKNTDRYTGLKTTKRSNKEDGDDGEDDIEVDPVQLSDAERQQLKENISMTESLRTGLITDFWIKALAIAAAFIITTVLISVSSQRRQRIGMYNYDIMNKNGEIMSQSSKSLLSHIYDDIWYGKLMSDTERSALGFLVPDIYSIDVIKKNMGSFKNTGNVTVNDIDGRIYRDELVDIIEAHGKCNALLFGANLPMPFPSYEISIYIFMIVVVLLCGTVLTYKMKPIETLHNLRFWNKIKVNRNRNKMIVIEESKLTGIAPEKLGQDTDLIIKILTLVMIPIGTLLFASQLIKSTGDLGTTLYGSNLYRSNNCYDL